MKRDEYDAIMSDFHARMKAMQPEPPVTRRAKFGPTDCRFVTPEGRAIIERRKVEDAKRQGRYANLEGPF